MVSKPSSRSAQRRVHAAVVELDALADAVRAAAQDDDLPPRAGPRLVVARARRSSRGTACRPRTPRRRCRPSCRPARCPSRLAPRRAPPPRSRRGARASRTSEKPMLLERAERARRRARRGARPPSARSSAIISSMWRRNHGSIARQLRAPRRRSSPRRNASPTCHSRSAFGRAQPLAQLRRRWRPARGSKPWLPISSERIAFCSDSLKVRPIAIASPTDFICGPSVSLGLRELLEGEARDLGDDVVDRRLEAGRRLARDVVADLVERVADGELGGDLGDREAGRLGRQRRAARHARVHLDDDQPAGRRGGRRTGCSSRRCRRRSRG